MIRSDAFAFIFYSGYNELIVHYKYHSVWISFNGLVAIIISCTITVRENFKISNKTISYFYVLNDPSGVH